jgi:NADH-quinone oxidoreductase subunit C
MPPTEQLRDRILARFPDADVTVVTNPGPAAQHSLLVGRAHAVEVAKFLRDDPELRLDFCSNMTGIDWPTATGKLPADDSGFLEAVYHLYSMALKHGPVVLRVRSADRSAPASLPSLTPVWRSCEFQEREAYDLYGISFEGHPDLRRILMWDEFEDFPMRKDYTEPDDYEWEPTGHGDVAAKSARHAPKVEAAGSKEQGAVGDPKAEGGGLKA